ncbi:MAG: hypothetical protein JEZ00_10345 [Anaerolineaceae bacterium]|nr:hypothetical protein [Anaerolineaceae bacterium]
MGRKGANKKKPKQIKAKTSTNSDSGTSSVLNTVASALDNKSSASKSTGKKASSSGSVKSTSAEKRNRR